MWHWPSFLSRLLSDQFVTTRLGTNSLREMLFFQFSLAVVYAHTVRPREITLPVEAIWDPSYPVVKEETCCDRKVEKNGNISSTGLTLGYEHDLVYSVCWWIIRFFKTKEDRWCFVQPSLSQLHLCVLHVMQLQSHCFLRNPNNSVKFVWPTTLNM